MVKRKVFEFLIMPFIPALRNVVSFRVMFIPEIILSLIFALTLLNIDKFMNLKLSFTVKIFSVLFCQAVLSVFFHSVMSLNRNTQEVIGDITYDRKIALVSFISILGILSSLLLLYLS